MTFNVGDIVGTNPDPYAGGTMEYLEYLVLGEFKDLNGSFIIGQIVTAPGTLKNLGDQVGTASDAVHFVRVGALAKLGDSGAVVKEVQQLLKMEQTGFFGNYTESEVKNFQKLKNIPVNGIVDQATMTALKG